MKLKPAIRDRLYIPAAYTVTLGELLQDDHFDIGLDDYPIFEESYRETLNTAIVDHYWFREIGVNTPYLFVFFLNRTMREQMPYYNKLYKLLTDFEALDPFRTTDITQDGSSKSKTDATGKTTSIDTSTSESDTDAETRSKARALASDTPQVQLSGREDYASGLNDTVSVVEADTRSTGKNASEGRGTSEDVSNSLNDFLTHTYGYNGLPADMMTRTRESLLNVNVEVLNMLERCFIGIDPPVGGMW